MRIISLLFISLLSNSLYALDNSAREPAPASIAPAQRCIKGNFGDTACGYNCMRSISRVACANSPDQHCLADKFGRIRCGRDCRLDQHNRIKCQT